VPGCDADEDAGDLAVKLGLEEGDAVELGFT
jgi:hypothetical protein